MKGKNLTALGWDQGESLFLLLFVQFLLPLQFLLWSKAVLSLIFCHFCWLKCPSPPCPALSHAYSWTLLRATRKVLLSQLSRHWNLEIYRAKSNFIASIWSGDCVDEEYSEGQNMKRKEKGLLTEYLFYAIRANLLCNPYNNHSNHKKNYPHFIEDENEV